MKIIALETGSTAPFTISNHGGGGPSAWLPVPMRKVDVLSFVQGTFSKPKNRSNTLLQVSFTVSKEHASFTAAQLYLMDINSLVPKQGPIRIDFEDQTTTRLIPDATIEVTPLPILGVRTTLNYTIKYGCEMVDGFLHGGDGTSTVFDYNGDGNILFYNNFNGFSADIYTADKCIFLSADSTPFNGEQDCVEGSQNDSSVWVPDGTFVAADVESRTFGIYPVS